MVPCTLFLLTDLGGSTLTPRLSLANHGLRALHYRQLFLAAVLLFLFAGLCAAQSVTGGGTIQGTVKDQAGSAIPKAKVTVTHVETGTVNNTETNGDGYFATPP